MKQGVILEINTIQRIQCGHHSVMNQFLSKIPLYTRRFARINVSKRTCQKEIPEVKNVAHKIRVYHLKNLNCSLSSEVNKKTSLAFSCNNNLEYAIHLNLNCLR